MSKPGRVGVIADNSLQGHLLTSAIEGQGYRVVVRTDPANLEARWLGADALDLWVVDLSSEDRWQGVLDTLLEEATAPLLFCDGQAPSRATDQYPRWERRLLTKLVSYIGKPPVDEHLETLPTPPAPIHIPAPREFPAIDMNERPKRVWVLGASLGGPAAVKRFLDCLPARLPVAFVLAQHIDAHFLEPLCDVLTKHNHFHCKVGYDGEALRHGQITIAPVDYAVGFRHDGRVYNTGQPWEGPYSPSIDQVLRHTLKGFGPAAGAIVFSGMGNDGAIAAPELAHQGCPIWAQTAETCAVSSQPDSVRDTGCVSYSGSPEELALQLVEQVRRQLATGDSDADN